MNTTTNIANAYPYAATQHETVKTEDREPASVWETVRTVWAFLPLITSLAWLVYMIPNLPIYVVDFILLPMMVVGWVAAVTYRPLRFLKFVGKMIGKPFLAGLIIPFIPVNLALAVVFSACGLAAVIFLMVFAPAILSIIHYFQGE